MAAVFKCLFVWKCMWRQNSCGDLSVFWPHCQGRRQKAKMFMVFTSFTKWKLLLLRANCLCSGKTLYNFVIPKTIEVVKKNLCVFVCVYIFKIYIIYSFLPFPFLSMDITLNTNQIPYWCADCYGVTLQSHSSLTCSWLGIQRPRACSVLNGLRTGVTQLESLADTSACAWFGTKNSILWSKVSKVNHCQVFINIFIVEI